jgi:hypothetical protein
LFTKSSNVKLNKGLAFLIAENNDASKTKTLVKGADGQTRESRRKSKGATIKEIDKITSGIMGIGDNGKYIALGVVVILAGVGLYFYLKHRKKMASEGMQVDGVDPATIEATPEVVVPPVVEPTPPVAEAPIEAVATPEVAPVV